jgi:ferric iron reductase protein FhuF
MSSSVAPSDIVTAIDQVTVGDYECFAGCLARAGDPRTSVMAGKLLDAPMRALIEKRFAERFDSFDPRAVHSIWMKWYLNAILPPLLLADVILARKMPMALDRVRFIVGDDGRVSSVILDSESEDSTGVDPFERFQGLIFDHFAPLIEIWSAHTDVTRRVYWSNVGNTFEAMLRRIELISGPSLRLSEAQRLIDEPRWPDGRTNPLFDAVHYAEESGLPERRRRVCCLQYALPDRRFCRACPIEEPRMAHPAKAAAC